MSKRGRQQSQRGHQGRQGQMGGRRQTSSDRTPWQSNDWGRQSQDWNDGGIGGGMDRPRHMSDDSRFDRDERHSEWESDQGRASYGYDPSRNFGPSGPYGSERPYGRGDYGFGERGSHRPQFGSQSEWRGGPEQSGSNQYGSGQYGSSRYGQAQFGHGQYGQYDQDRDRYSQDRGQYGQGQYGQGPYGQGEYGRGSFGEGGYGQGRYGRNEYGRQHEHGQMGSFAGGMANRGAEPGRWGNHSGRGPKGYQRSDERIREDVSDSLTEDPEVDASEITVEARDGEVTLSGTVQTREEKRAAESCAEEVSGVREVINQLRVSRGGSSGESSMSSSTTSGRTQSGQGSQSGKSSRSSSES